jgi:hypothetical protein
LTTSAAFHSMARIRDRMRDRIARMLFVLIDAEPLANH